MVTHYTVLAPLVGLIALNYVIVRTPYARRYPAVFWTINALDLAVAVGVLLFGLPGFSNTPMVRLMVGLLVGLHLAQNFQAKSRWDAEDRRELLDAEAAERAALEREETPPP